MFHNLNLKSHMWPVDLSPGKADTWVSQLLLHPPHTAGFCKY